MNFKKLSSFLTIAIFSLTGFKAFSADVHGVFCGSELRPIYVDIADEYMKNNPGVNVTLEAVPWGTCQDKVINLAIKNAKSLSNKVLIDGKLASAKSINENLIENGLKLKPLNMMKKFA